MKRFAVLCLGLFFCCPAIFSQTKPNIVFILVDDMGWTDLHCYGSSFYETPNIDKLASSGMRFTDAYSASTVCSPSRASLMTGKSPARLKITDWIPGYFKPYAKLLSPEWNLELPLEEQTIAELLRKQGYSTAIVGKWHLGDDVKYYPENQGFDLNIAGTYQGQPPSYFSPYGIPRLKNGPTGEFLTERQTDEAIKFINDKKSKPFFLYLSFYGVHTPLQAKAEDVAYFKKKADKENQQQNPTYAAMIKGVDDGVGRIMSTLNSLKLEEKTLVVFMSDNGGLLGGGTWEKGRITSNFPLRDGKGSGYEGGVRVPAIFSWKGKIKANTVSSVPIIGTDLFYTFANLGGVKQQEINAHDGMSVLPMLLGQTSFKRDALYWHYPHYHPGGSPYGPCSSIRQGDWKLIYFYETGKKELYNLKVDISEKNDLYVSQTKLAEAMYSKLTAWKKEVGAQEPSMNPAYNLEKKNQNAERKARKVEDPKAVN